MTILDDTTTADLDLDLDDEESDELELLTPRTDDDDEEDASITWADVQRPLLATALATCGTGLVIGGVFGSWAARAVCVVAALIGTGWVFVARRSSSPVITQLLIVPVLLAVGIMTLVGTSGGGPNELPRLVSDAIESGRLFRPPVPFDPGWRPILVFLVGMLAFGAGSIAVVQQRPKMGIAVTVPVTILALVSQPDDSAFLGGVFAFLPIIGALAVLFGDDRRASELSRGFEAKRALRGALGAIVVVGLLYGVSSANFLFPEPVYDPEDQPQKPRAVPLSVSRDRVLFEVETESTLTGPWRVGALDVYDDDAFQSVYAESRLEDIPANGSLSDLRTGRTPVEVTIAIRDLGDTSSAPLVAGATTITFAGDSNLRYDPRYEVLRVTSGRVAADTTYTLSLPPYATEEELEAAVPGSGADFEDHLAVPAPPRSVEDLLREAPPEPWLRLDFLRQTLLDRVVAAGAGSPTDVSVERAGEIMAEPEPNEDGSEGEGNEATPFEIVATEALLARWAGIPSRIGFGFDGLNVEDGRFTVRPQNSAQWLEVYFEDFGWVPLIGQPAQAKASLDHDPLSRDTPEVEASSDVAVQVHVVYERRNLRLLYERIRDQILFYAPFVLSAIVLYLLYPWGAKLWRARRRRLWAAEIGPLAQVVVEYAAIRDLCIDLNIGDDYDTPLEYLHKVAPDREHEEIAWLTTRALYGDLGESLGPDDVRAAEDLSRSVRRRLARAQPLQSQVLGHLSRASIEVPYSTELPNIRVVRVYPTVRRASLVVFGPFGRAMRDGARGIARGARFLIDRPRLAIARRLPAIGGQP